MKVVIITLCVAFLAKCSVAFDGRVCYCTPEPNVCGSDFRNYAGECNLKCAASREGRQIYMIYNGPCEDLYGPNPNPYPDPYGSCDPCGIFSRYQPYNPYNPYNPNNDYNPYFGSGKKAYD